MKFYEKFGAEDVLRRIFVLDALILNTDRHLGNFGFLFDNQRMEVKTAAPMFDHNRSLLFDLDEDQLARPDWYISKCRPRIGVDFIRTAKLPQRRLEALNAVVERQRRSILE